MSSEEAIAELARLTRALVHEQQAEEQRLSAIIEKQSLRLRRQEGLTWSPVSIEKQGFSFGGRVTVEIQKTAKSGLDDAFRVGMPVSFYQANEAGQPLEESEVRRGIVRKIRPKGLEIVLDGAPLQSSQLHERWTLDERADDRTFRLMAESLNHWINTEDPAELAQRDRLLGLKPFSDNQEHAPLLTDLSGLNERQRDWIVHSLAASELSLLHGPPGTGKTTTLLHYMSELVQRGERLLVCAPSNAAVDVLVKGCVSRSIPVVRIGNPVRLDEEVLAYELEALVTQSPEYKQVLDFRKRAEQAWQIVHRFHRSFGQEERKRRAESKQEARELQKEARNLESYIAERIVRKAPVVCCTLAGAADSSLAGQRFSEVLIDEAGQALQPAAWIAFRKAKKVILAGDPHQLPPVVFSKESVNLGLAVSALERLMNAHHNQASDFMMHVQYRMHPNIMQPSSTWFYQGALRAGNVSGSEETGMTYRFIDTAGCGFEEERDGKGESTVNPEEARFALERLTESLRQNEDFRIGVIAPYRAQVNALREMASEMDVIRSNWDRVEFATVDAFQGQEREEIIISMTRSNPEGIIGFLREYRRMNVAMTRAKHRLTLIGDGATMGGDPYYKHIMDAADKCGGYHSAWEWLYTD